MYITIVRIMRGAPWFSNCVFLFDALTTYCLAWLGAFGAAGRRLAPLSAQRLVFLLVLFPLGLLLWCVHSCCLFLDELLYPAYRRRKVKSPIFILGVPRSGTTFLHRQLARDSHFISSSVWEVLFAPAICQRRLVAFLAATDARLQNPVRKWITRLFADASADIQDVHPVGLNAAEEDYLLLLASAGCFFMSLAFPAATRLSDLARISALSPPRRERLLDHYHRLLQRQLFVCGDRQLLSKNAAFASWAPYLAQRYPDALMIICIREPQTALASQLSSLKSARKLFGSYPDQCVFEREFAGYYVHWYRCLRVLGEQSEHPILVVEQEWLRQHSERFLQSLYAHLERELPRFADTAEPAPHGYSYSIGDASGLSIASTDYQALKNMARSRWGHS